jgi:hypothetical protein
LGGVDSSDVSWPATVTEYIKKMTATSADFTVVS